MRARPVLPAATSLSLLAVICMSLLATFSMSLLALACPPAQAAAVSVERSGWLWSNPMPEGESLNDVTFDGERGYAVGENGTLLRSDDGGLSWTGLPSETEANLSLVQSPEPNTVIAGGGCTLLESTDAGASFQPVRTLQDLCSKYGIASFSFLTAQTGFIRLSNGQLLLTTNAGETVEARRSLPAGSGAIDFLTPSTGVALAQDKGGAEVLRTTDGGASWTTVASSPASLDALTFVTPSVGYAVGADSTVLRTSDGGETWSAEPLALPAGTQPLELGQIACGQPTNCLITIAEKHYDAATLVRTSDGGVTGTLVNAANQANLDFYYDDIASVAFSGSSTAVAVGEEGETLISDDGGESFAAPGYAGDESSSSRRQMRIGQSALDAYLPLEGGAIAATNDGGDSWATLRVPTQLPIVDVAFPTTQVGYALAGDGEFFKTTTAGRTWSIMRRLHGGGSAVLAPSEQTVVVIGAQGIWRSTDGAASFRKLDPTVVLAPRHGHRRTAKLSRFGLADGAYLAGGAIFAFENSFQLPGGVFENSVLESTDDGGHWSIVPPPKRGCIPEAISFVSPTTGYDSCDGELFFTRQRGRRWSRILALGSDTELEYPPVNLSFSSAVDGYITVSYEEADLRAITLLRTEDGGRSWTPEYIPYLIGQVLATGSVDYATASLSDKIYKTTDGGLNPNRSTITLAIAGGERTSASRLKRAGGKVGLVGHLAPAASGQTVKVSWEGVHQSYWRHANAQVAADGGFALTAPGIREPTRFVAQYKGRDTASGAGTHVVELAVTGAASRP